MHHACNNVSLKIRSREIELAELCYRGVLIESVSYVDSVYTLQESRDSAHHDIMCVLFRLTPDPPLTERPAPSFAYPKQWYIIRFKRKGAPCECKSKCCPTGRRNVVRKGRIVFKDTVANAQKGCSYKSLQAGRVNGHDARVEAELICLSEAKDDVIAEY